MNGIPSLRALACVPVACLALAGCSRDDDTAQAPSRPDESLPAIFAHDDAEARVAIHKAQVSLDEFEQRLTHPPAGQTYLALRGRFVRQGIAEDLWLSDVNVAADGFRGRISSGPAAVPGLAAGQEVTLSRDAISDWMAIEEGYLIAGYSLRLQRDRLSPEERERFDTRGGFKIEE